MPVFAKNFGLILQMLLFLYNLDWMLLLINTQLNSNVTQKFIN